MIKILLIRSTKAYLPEIDIYKEYLKDSFRVFIVNSDDKINFSDFDIIWKFMGFDFFDNFKLNTFLKNFINSRILTHFYKTKNLLIKTSNKNNNISPFIIHEYASLSSGKFKKFKNFLKKNLNSRPNLRIFLNEKVKKEMNFSDNIPFLYRDMGIDKHFFLSHSHFLLS